MFQIRQGAFETNSSSVHAICISKESVTVPEETCVRITPQKFGWESDVYCGFTDKLAYLSALIGKDPRQRYLLTESLERLNIQAEFTRDEGWSPYGYVDHGYEANDFVEHVLASDDALARFLFNSKSYIETGNDNGSQYPEEPVDYNGLYFMKEN